MANTLSLFATSNTVTLSEVTTVTFDRLRPDNDANLFSGSTTTNTFESIDKFSNTCLNSFVFGASKFNASTTTKLFEATFSDNTDLIAKRRTFLGSL